MSRLPKRVITNRACDNFTITVDDTDGGALSSSLDLGTSIPDSSIRSGVLLSDILSVSNAMDSALVPLARIRHSMAELDVDGYRISPEKRLQMVIFISDMIDAIDRLIHDNRSLNRTLVTSMKKKAVEESG